MARAAQRVAATNDTEVSAHDGASNGGATDSSNGSPRRNGSHESDRPASRTAAHGASRSRIVIEEPRRGNPVPESSVAAMFDEIAPDYDKLNTLMTFGFDARWRRAAVDAANVQSGGSAIDVACGTGKLALELAERIGPFGRVLAVDLSPGMIRRASAAFRDVVQLEFRVGNALALPASCGASCDRAVASSASSSPRRGRAGGVDCSARRSIDSRRCSAGCSATPGRIAICPPRSTAFRIPNSSPRPCDPRVWWT
jgi:hypothetical protein